MSNAIFNQIAGGLITLNDSLRAAFLPDDAACFLIKRAEFSGTRWTVVRELTRGWFLEFSEYRGQFKLLYATLDAGFTDEIAQTSFIAYGVPNFEGEIDVFRIDPERRDVIPPTGTNSQWKIYVDKAPLERFLIPAISGLPLPIPTITTPALSGATQGAAYHQTIATSGGTATRFAVIRGTPPPGIVFNFSTRSFDGPATGSGDFEFDFAAYNADGFYSYRTFTVRVAGFVPPPVPTELVNYAAASRGATALASSTYSEPGYSGAAANAINGNRLFGGANWGAAPGDIFHSLGSPATLEITFPENRNIKRFDVFTVRDNQSDKSELNQTETFSLYGVIDYTIQIYDGAAWQTVVTVTGNNKVWKQSPITPVNTTKFRVVTTNAGATHTRLMEVEAWG